MRICNAQQLNIDFLKFYCMSFLLFDIVVFWLDWFSMPIALFNYWLMCRWAEWRMPCQKFIHNWRYLIKKNPFYFIFSTHELLILPTPSTYLLDFFSSVHHYCIVNFNSFDFLEHLNCLGYSNCINFVPLLTASEY